MNLLQLINAHNNLYFDKWETRREIEKLVEIGNPIRGLDLVQVSEWVKSENENKSKLFQLYEQMPNLGLNLSFIKIRKKAKKVHVSHRIMKYRKQPLRDHEYLDFDEDSPKH